MADATLTIGADATEAIKSIGKFQQAASESLKKLEGSFGSLKTIAVGAVGFLAAGKIVDALDDVVTAALEVEKATAALKTQLKLTGEFSADAVDDFKKYADSLERTSDLGDDLILSQLAVAKSFGVTNEQAKKMTTAAAELSAAMGISFDAAVQQLGKSFSGLTGKLDEQIPEIKKLTKAQLENGDAVELVLNRYGGSAAANLDTFGGAIRSISVEYGNLKEAIGEIITQSPVLRELLKQIAAALRNSADAAGDLDGALELLGDALLYSVAISQKVAQAVQVIAAALDALVLVADVSTTVVKGYLDRLESPFTTLADTATFGVLPIIDYFLEIKRGGKASDAMSESVERVRSSLESVGVWAASASNKLDDIGDAMADARTSDDRTTTNGSRNTRARISDLDAERKARDELLKAAIASAESADKALSAALKTADDERRRAILQARKDAEALAKSIREGVEKSAASPVSFFVKLVVDKAGIEAIDLSPLQASAAGAAAGMIASALDGAAGAKRLISSAAAAFGDALIPGIGPVVGTIFDKLAQGPDEVKKFVREFVKAMPDILVAIGEAAPAFVEAMVDAFVNEGGAVKVGVAIARAMVGEGFFKSAGKQLGLEAGSAFNSSNIAQTIAAGFAIGSVKIQQAFAGALPSLQAFLTNAQAVGFAFGQSLSETLKAAPQLIISAFNQGAAEAVTSLRLVFDEAFGKLASGLREALANLAIQIPEPAWVEKIREILSGGLKLPGSSGGGEGAVPDSVPILGKFASGGTVPPGFNNDSFSAFLSSGEMVIPTDDVTRLRQFMDSGGGGASDGVVSALLAQILAALNQPMQVATTATLNGNALADIILNLSRRNARLSA